MFSSCVPTVKINSPTTTWVTLSVGNTMQIWEFSLEVTLPLILADFLKSWMANFAWWRNKQFTSALHALVVLFIKIWLIIRVFFMFMQSGPSKDSRTSSIVKLSIIRPSNTIVLPLDYTVNIGKIFRVSDLFWKRSESFLKRFEKTKH